MKEASGELSMTAVAVVAIAAIGLVFSQLIWPNMKAAILSQQHCSSAFNCSGTGATQTCWYCTKEDCTITAKVMCAPKTK